LLPSLHLGDPHLGDDTKAVLTARHPGGAPGRVADPLLRAKTHSPSMLSVPAMEMMGTWAVRSTYSRRGSQFSETYGPKMTRQSCSTSS